MINQKLLWSFWYYEATLTSAGIKRLELIRCKLPEYHILECKYIDRMIIDYWKYVVIYFDSGTRYIKMFKLGVLVLEQNLIQYCIQ